jgi:hypothetical protein
MFEGPVETSQQVGSQAVAKIEHRDHGAQKTGKCPGEQKSLPSAGHGPLPHFHALRLTRFCGAVRRLDIKQYHVSECGHAENALLDFVATWFAKSKQGQRPSFQAVIFEH